MSTNVVFGAAGSLGAAITNELVKNGQQVRAVLRNPAKAQGLLPESVELVKGDALDADFARTACKGISTIYHCINVPYHMWEMVMPEVTGNILTAAREAGARLVFPGNVYGYGHFNKTGIDETHPKNAHTKKGCLRNEMESRIMESHQKGEIQAVIPRFPDYYGPNVINPLYAPLFEAALKKKTALWMINADVPHDLIFINDAAAASITLANSEQSYGHEWHVPGAGPLTGRQFVEMIFQEAGTKPHLKVLRPGFIKLGALFNPVMREFLEMIYLFSEPQVLDGSKFARAFPQFRYTSHQEAIRQTLAWFRQKAN